MPMTIGPLPFEPAPFFVHPDTTRPTAARATSRLTPRPPIQLPPAFTPTEGRAGPGGPASVQTFAGPHARAGLSRLSTGGRRRTDLGGPGSGATPLAGPGRDH